MKPFNLEAAKRGDAIVRDDGVRLSFVAHVPGAVADQRLICMIEGGYIRTYTEDGRVFERSGPVLFMGVKKHARTVYVNFYMAPDGYVSCSHVHATREDADEGARDGRGGLQRRGEAREITIEWEE